MNLKMKTWTGLVTEHSIQNLLLKPRQEKGRERLEIRMKHFQRNKLVVATLDVVLQSNNQLTMIKWLCEIK